MDAKRISVEEIETMGRADLVRLWPELFPGPVPDRASPEFLRLALGWKFQAEEMPQVIRRLSRRLDQIAGKLADGRVPGALDARPKARLGTILERTWRGRAYTVTVTDQGCVLDGTTYRSLSEVARRITGTRWNGPSFFGLRTAKGNSSGRGTGGSRGN